MKMSKFKSSLLILAILVLVSFAHMRIVYATEGDQHVNVIMAWDEEMEAYAWNCGWDQVMSIDKG